jgi:hypothetical protein
MTAVRNIAILRQKSRTVKAPSGYG